MYDFHHSCACVPLHSQSQFSHRWYLISGICLSLQHRILGADFFNKVCGHLKLLEKEYFGLEFRHHTGTYVSNRHVTPDLMWPLTSPKDPDTPKPVTGTRGRPSVSVCSPSLCGVSRTVSASRAPLCAFRTIEHVELAVEPVGERHHSEPVALVGGLSMTTHLVRFLLIFHLHLFLSFSTTKRQRAENASPIVWRDLTRF